jgi:hypothetical protein
MTADSPCNVRIRRAGGNYGDSQINLLLLIVQFIIVRLIGDGGFALVRIDFVDTLGKGTGGWFGRVGFHGLQELFPECCAAWKCWGTSARRLPAERSPRWPKARRKHD